MAAPIPPRSDPVAMRLLRTATARPPGTVKRMAQAVALPAPGDASLGLRLGRWVLRVLRECVYLLLCSWCIRELLE